MRINTNLTAMNTFTQYTNNNKKIASSVAKLSSGSAINSAADNATGLAISEKMRAQIRGLSKAQTNAQDAISLVQTAEGALSSSTEILQRMRELAVQSSSDTNENQIDRTALQDEFSQLQKELDDIAGNTTFNKKNLLDGSLSATTKNLGTTTLGNSGMTVQLGNANTGTYNFSVSTKLVSAAVTEAKAAEPELVMDGAENYFKGGTNTVKLGDNVEPSDLLNGNYTLKATYADPTNDKGDGQIKITATGDNGQKFQAVITKDDLTALSTGKNLQINFNASADDAFKLNLNLTSTVAAGESNYDTLAANISKLSVSVSGGVSARDAEYGVFANLTGAESVKLESGMGSVTFDNGVKVNFDTLTATSVDTKNKAVVTDATAVVNPSAAGTFAATGNAINGATVSAATFTLEAAPAATKIAGGDYTIASDATGNLTLTDSKGAIFTAAAKSTVAGAAIAGANNFVYDFKDSSGVQAFQGTLSATAPAAQTFTTGAVVLSKSLTGTNGYAMTTPTFGTSATMSNFSFTDDSVIVDGDMAITAKTTGTTTTFTATDANNTKYTATIDNADMLATDATTGSAVANGSVKNTLSFVSTDPDKAAGFSVDLTTVNDNAAVGVKYGAAEANVLTGMTVDKAGHNYAKIFGNYNTTADNLSISTDSSFSVEETANAGLTFQVGANEGDEMVINIEKMDANYIGVSSAAVGTRTAAQAAIKAVDSAINQVSSQRAYLGAIQNRLEYKISNLNTSTENLTSAESQIRDVDMAKEMTAFTNANILNQASTAMLAQANSLPQAVLSLIGK